MARLGPFLVAMVSKTLESTGVVEYHQLVVVFNEAGDEIYYVTAESNGLDQPKKFYLGYFEPEVHGTMNSSLLLLITPVFFCAACRMVREYLNLDFETAPLTEPEIQALEIMPEVCSQYVPDWREHSRWLIEFIRDGLPEAHPSRGFLDAALLEGSAL